MNKQLQEKIKNIETNLETLTGAVKELVQSLDEPKAVDVTPPVRPTKWRAKEGERYWFIGQGGVIDVDGTCEDFYEIDNYRYLTGNYYRTREEAEQALEVIKAKGRLEHSYYALVGDWKPSKDFFEDSIELKNQQGIDWESLFYNYILSDGDIYYIPPINKWFENEIQFTQFIKENEEDLKTVFGLTRSIND